MKLVITFTDIHNENDPEELFSVLMSKSKGLSEEDLIEVIIELLTQRSEHWPQEHSILLLEDDVLLEG
ncbi:hypothetical protein ACGTN6_20715, partial [Halomonas sp. THAF12]|uniref:hypothetical protein n=1 Tax=Halomonas sp. B23F22_10 TaxID=3459515 RepID=UPI00373E9A84